MLQADSVAAWPATVSGWAGLVQTILTIVAFFAAGGWAYFHFWKGRTFKERLDVTARGSIRTAPGGDVLAVTLQAKNIGLSKVEIQQAGSALELFQYVPSVTEIGVAVESGWSSLAIVPVFTQNKWLEPGEMAREQRLFDLPPDAGNSVRLSLQVAFGKYLSFGSAVVFVDEEGSQDE